jgi:predicted transcriptional regulator
LIKDGFAILGEQPMRDPELRLTRRERQIMQAIHARGEATAKQVAAAITDPPSNTAIRTMLTNLVEKKILRFRKQGREYVYLPASSPDKTRRGALRNLMSVFFGGSIESLLASHLSDPQTPLDEETLLRLERMVRDARKGGSQS